MRRWPSVAIMGCLLCCHSVIATEKANCNTFRSHVRSEKGPTCLAKCAYRVQCQEIKGTAKNEGSYCAKLHPPSHWADQYLPEEWNENKHCARLLRKGQKVWFPWNQSLLGGSGCPPEHMASGSCGCISCADIRGCNKCVGYGQGKVTCAKDGCADNFDPVFGDDGGVRTTTCSFKHKSVDIGAYILLVVVGVLVVWIIIDLARGVCATHRNWDALERGLVMRRKALLNEYTGEDDEKTTRYPLSTSLHYRTAARLMGPGLPLFMNWFIYIFILGLWLFVGTALFVRASTEEKAFLDPCRQQEKINKGWDIINKRTPSYSARDMAWSMFNYVGAVIISVCFLLYQNHLWSLLRVDEESHPYYSGYTIEISNVPTDITNKNTIQEHLGRWLSTLGFEKDGISEISVAWDIPADTRTEVEELLDYNVATAIFRRTSLRQKLPIVSEECTDAGPRSFWIQLVAAILFQTPFHWPGRNTCRFAQDDHNTMVEMATQIGKPELRTQATTNWGTKAENILTNPNLKGSGTIFVVMKTEPLARAVASVAEISLPGLTETPLRVQKAAMEPPMVRWFDFGFVEWQWRFLRVLRTVVVLFGSLWLWFLLFSAFLIFELNTEGHTGPSKAIAGLFVGMLVPIGNAIFTAIIALLMKHQGFSNEVDLRMWRQILNVLINLCAIVGEVYLVAKKAISGLHVSTSKTDDWHVQTSWGLLDFLWVVSQVQPIGALPSAIQFQEEMKAILVPAGMLVPIITIPLLSDFLPYAIGYLRIKADPELTAADAERIMKPEVVDPAGPYTDFIVNLCIICFASWVSPGRYLLVLWFLLCLWVVLLYINTHLNVLRWQGCTYFASKREHNLASYLMAIPLGLLCAQMDHQYFPEYRSGLLGLVLHLGFHFVFVRFVLDQLGQKRKCFGTTLEDMKAHPNAPVASYRNTNPIEILQAQHLGIDVPDSGFLTYFTEDKAYLQRAPVSVGNNDISSFTSKGEDADLHRALTSKDNNATFLFTSKGEDADCPDVEANDNLVVKKLEELVQNLKTGNLTEDAIAQAKEAIQLAEASLPNCQLDLPGMTEAK